jgi:hypothetical protein
LVFDFPQGPREQLPDTSPAAGGLDGAFTSRGRVGKVGNIFGDGGGEGSQAGGKRRMVTAADFEGLEHPSALPEIKPVQKMEPVQTGLRRPRVGLE